MINRTVSVGRDPKGQPTESLHTKIKASHHINASERQERLIRSYPWPLTFAEFAGSSYERTIVQVPPFASSFVVSFTTTAESGNMVIRYYGSGGNVENTVYWSKTDGAPEYNAVISLPFDLDPVTTSSPSTALLRFYPSVDMVLTDLAFEFS
jgi:hypothetical protein